MFYSDRIRKGFLFAALIVPWLLLTYSWFAQAPQSKNSLVLPTGTRIFVQVIENIGVAGVKEEGVFRARTAEEVRAQGTVIIPKDSIAHIRVTNNSGQADGGVALYSAQLIDVEFAGQMYAVSTDTRDFPIDSSTGSPYSGRITGLIIPENTLLEFTLKAPFSINGP